MNEVLSKIVTMADLIQIRSGAREDGKVVVWTNGCFDILHIGHARSLIAARQFGDLLIVGVNSDASVRRIKGPNRPLFPETERAELLSCLQSVDYLIVFDELTPETVIERLRPEVCCKGEDYAPPNGKPIPEAATIKAYGGRLVYTPIISATSTSDLVRRIHLQHS